MLRALGFGCCLGLEKGDTPQTAAATSNAVTSDSTTPLIDPRLGFGTRSTAYRTLYDTAPHHNQPECEHNFLQFCGVCEAKRVSERQQEHVRKNPEAARARSASLAQDERGATTEDVQRILEVAGERYYNTINYFAQQQDTRDRYKAQREKGKGKAVDTQSESQTPTQTSTTTANKSDVDGDIET